MSIIKFISNSWQTNAKHELKSAFSRENTLESYPKFSSVKGRTLCVLLILPHFVAALGAKSLLYGMASMVHTVACLAHLTGAVCYKCSGDDDPKKHHLRRAKKNLFKSLNYVGCAAVAPVGQVARLAKAFAGVFYSGAYYRRTGAAYDLMNARILCHRKYLGKDIHRELQILVDHPIASVKFKHEDGIDGGGLSNEFRTAVYANISREMNMDEGIAPWSKSSDTALKNLGKMFGYCFTQEYRSTGTFFHEDYFKAIYGFSEHFESSAFPQDFEEIENKDLEAILKSLTPPPPPVPEYLEKFRELVQQFKEGNLNDDETVQLVLTLRWMLLEAYYEMDGTISEKSLETLQLHPDNKCYDKNYKCYDKNYVNALEVHERDALIEEVLNNLDSISIQVEKNYSEDKENIMNCAEPKLNDENRLKLKTVHSIVKGMLEGTVDWIDIDLARIKKAGSAENLSENIQGKFNKETFINVIRLSNQLDESDYPDDESDYPDLINYVTEWMKKQNNETLKSLLLGITNLAYVPSQVYIYRELLMLDSQIDNYIVSTCGKYLTFKLKKITYEAVAAQLEDLAAHPQSAYNRS